ncbi:MAG: hypothetical protein DRQ62_10345, partial [Gammaproteobacteria bacterium]
VAGSVYLYAPQDNWRISAELKTHSTADNFAKRIVLSDDILIVSADGDGSHGKDSGAVYIFERHSVNNSEHWQQTAKLTATDTQAGDRFGSAIAYVNNVLYIGAPLRGQGKVYIFTRNSASGDWQNTDNIVPEDPQALRFGAAIAQEQQTLIIGAPYTDAEDSEQTQAKIRQPRFAISKGDTVDPGIESGAIFVYTDIAGKWQATTRIGSSNRETGDHLGADIAIEDNIIAASIRQKDVFDHLRAGTIYIYKYVANGWHEDSALVASEPNIGANFGGSFSLLDKQILAGANKVHHNGFNSGQAYLFSLGSDQSWELIHQQGSDRLNPHDQFGFSVAFDSEHLLIASKHSVYAYQSTPIQYHPAFFYTDNNTLHLNEVALAGIGVFSVVMDLSEINDELVLTLTDFHLRTGIDKSDIKYFISTGRITIPELAVQTVDGEVDLYTIELQQIENSANMQFTIHSISLIEP